MPFVTAPFQAYLAAPISSTDVTLPLSATAKADLVKLLCQDDAYTYLSLRDEVNFETVKAYLSCGELLIDRGQAGTTPVKFSFSTCVSTLSPTVAAVVTAMLSEQMSDCMAFYNPDAMGGVLGVAFTDLPTGTLANNWRGMIVLSGTLPMSVSVSGLPGWVKAVQYGNMLELTGKPTATATTAFTLHAKSVQENIEITQQFSIVVR